MGQKTNPIGFRLGVSRDWRSTWFATKEIPALLKEDALLRKYLKARLGGAAIADVTIERKPGKVVVTIHTGRPGVVIGKKGQAVEELKTELQQLTGKEVGVNVERSSARRSMRSSSRTTSPPSSRSASRSVGP